MADFELHGYLTTGKFQVNDYEIEIERVEGGMRMRVKDGMGKVQEAIVKDGQSEISNDDAYTIREMFDALSNAFPEWQKNEQDRKNAEHSRVSAETSRMNLFKQMQEALSKFDLDDINSKIAAATSTANGASTAADGAVITAQNAYNKADSIASTASNAFAAAQNAEATANEAMTTAQNAASTANDVLSNVQDAASTANEAMTTAQYAVSTANEALTTAQDAVSTANDADSAANAASEDAQNALSEIASLRSIIDQMYYQPGDTITIGDSGTAQSTSLNASGYVTGGRKRIHIKFLVSKRLDNISTVTCDSFVAHIINSGGAAMSASDNDGGYQFTGNIESVYADKVQNCIHVIFSKSDGFTLAENECVSARIGNNRNGVPAVMFTLM